MDKDEKVLCAAIWINCEDNDFCFQPVNKNNGFVIAGWRHGSILETMRIMGISHIRSEQGFLTSKNRFLDRVEAREFVLESSQLNETEFNDELFSEDLY